MKVSPIQTAFNNGAISPYMYGRVDIDKWALSLRECRNMIPLAQGPLTKRDATRFVVPGADETKKSWFLEFQFSVTQAYLVEINGTRVRFFTSRGLVLESEKTVTDITHANPAVVTSSSHGFVNGDQVMFPQVGTQTPLANRVFTVANKTTNAFELQYGDGAGLHNYDGTGLPAFGGTVKAARVYSITSPYAEADVPDVTYIRSADVVYLFHEDYQTRKLVRAGATSWSFELHDFKDGPYLTEDTQSTTMTPADTGNIAPDMTSNTAPSGTASALANNVDAWMAFNRDPATNYDTGGNNGWLAYAPTSSKVCDAYALQAPAATPGNMPATWTFEGFDGTNWVKLDRREIETGWSTGEVRYYSFVNKTAYQSYRLAWTALDGGSSMAVAGFTMHEAGDGQTAFNLTASSTTGINSGSGFQTSDVGRSIRLRGGDGLWRWAKIVARTSTTVVTIRLYGQALPDVEIIVRWRLGMFSAVTGWPRAGAFFADRLMLTGPKTLPHYIVSSMSAAYDWFSPTTEDGTPTAAHGFAYPIIEREVNRINWIVAHEKGLIISTPGGEAVIRRAVQTEVFSGLNLEIVWPTAYGSEKTRPRAVDTAILFAQQGGKRIREYTYVFTEDSYRAPDLTIMADHITGAGIGRVALLRHPRLLYWATRSNDGALIGMTYEREQNVIAWHEHFIGGTGVEVEEVAAIASPSGMSQDLWLSVKRTIGGQTRRYIEYIPEPFSHLTAQEDAVFADSALIYSGASTATFSGLYHLEGETVAVLVDGAEVAQQVVTNAAVTSPVAGAKAAIGLPYKARIRTLPLNAGARDGTPQGKKKRIFGLVMRLYRALGGKFGSPTGDLVTIQYREIGAPVVMTVPLFSGDTERLPFPGGWEQDGSLVIENDSAYPFTLTALMPSADVEDGG